MIDEYMVWDDPINDSWSFVMQLIQQSEPMKPKRVIVLGHHDNPMESEQYCTYSRFLDETGWHGGA